jgi:uncharacterized repeat protein (TIGR03803 family)
MRQRQTQMGRGAVCLTVAGWCLATFVSAGTLGAQEAPTFTYSVLYTFTGGTDGGFPYASLLLDQEGNLYGTTAEGGDLSGSCDYEPGCGVVFRIDPMGKQTVLHAFTGGPDGGVSSYNPALVRDPEGNLYGTLGGGGANGQGVVFKIDPKGKETVLYNFTGGADGLQSFYAAPLALDKAGNVYGTTYAGGDVQGPCAVYGGCGVIYRVDPAGQETLVYSFPGGALGASPSPFGPIISDGEGGLYDTNSDGGQYNFGTVYRLDAGGSTLLHTFTGGADGGQPWAGVIKDSQGNLYGTTAGGGIPCAIGINSSGCGVVYKIDPSGSETVLYSFTGGAEGGVSYAGLVRDPAGNLYGTTLFWRRSRRNL